MSKQYTAKSPADGMIIIPRDISDKLISAGHNEIRLALWLYAGNIYDTQSAAKALGISAEDAESALEYCKTLGMIREHETKKAASPSDRRPAYDSDVIANAIDKNEDFRLLCDQFSALIGKMLNRTDYNSLYYLFDYCGLSGGYIITATHYCISKGKKDMRYIHNTILSLYDEGVDDLTKLDRRLADKQRLDSDIARLRTLCGMGDRAFTTKEKQFAEKWFGEWSLDFELVRLAYERSVDATGRVNFAYMNKVLESWHTNGLTTPEKVASGDRKAGSDDAASFDSDEFFSAALQRSRRDNADDN